MQKISTAAVTLLFIGAVKAQIDPNIPLQSAPLDLVDVYERAAAVRLLREQSREIEIENQRREANLTNAESGADSESQDFERQNILNRFNEAIRYRRYRWEDFDSVVFAESLQLSLDMIALMAESRYAADIAYYLGNHPDEAAEISGMPLSQAGPSIFSIERELIRELD